MQPLDPRRRGFTLIEVIAAMSVLAIIMLMISQAYTSVNGSWRDGMISSDQNSGGRSALAFISRELSQVVVDDLYQMVVLRDDDTASALPGYGGLKDSAIWFTALSGQPRVGTTVSRQAQDICYYVTDGKVSEDGLQIVGFPYRKLQRIGNYELKDLASFKNADITDLDGGGNDFHGYNGTDLLNFVRRFEVNLFLRDKTKPADDPDAIQSMAEAGLKDYDSKDPNNGLAKYVPVFADIYLEVLGQDQAQIVAESGMSPSDAATFCEKNVQRFTTRVYFPNVASRNRSQP